MSNMNPISVCFVVFFAFVANGQMDDDALLDVDIPDLVKNGSDWKPFGILAFGKDVVRESVQRVSRVLEWVQSDQLTGGLDTNGTFIEGAIDSVKHHAKFIYPGTLWCGSGSKARNINELGWHQETDKCCRAHDSCPSNIPRSEEKFGLVNPGLFTRSHCDCDAEFYTCLKTADTKVSRRIGATYFNVLGPQCFKQDYPVIGCLSLIFGRCMQYDTRNEGIRIYQWFDTPLF